MSTEMPDLTLEVLKDIRSDLRELKTDVRELKTDVRGVKGELHDLRSEMAVGFQVLTNTIVTGFVETEHRLDAIVDITGRHHAALETRVARIEDHLKLAR
jgi:hypothetical protein